MLDYLELINENYPETECSCEGDTAVYENITFHGASVAKATLDGHYLAHLKSEKNSQVDLKTQSLISNGFVFDGKTFSLSVAAQINWMCLEKNCAQFTFPLPISTKTDGEYLISEANVPVFYLTGISHVKSIIDGGRNLKVSINACTTENEINAIVDNR